jgi:hypothetical protein
MLWKLVEEEVDLTEVRKAADLLANGTEDDYRNLLHEHLQTIDFFNAPLGRWLEAVAVLATR